MVWERMFAWMSVSVALLWVCKATKPVISHYVTCAWAPEHATLLGGIANVASLRQQLQNVPLGRDLFRVTVRIAGCRDICPKEIFPKDLLCLPQLVLEFEIDLCRRAALWLSVASKSTPQQHQPTLFARVSGDSGRRRMLSQEVLGEVCGGYG